MGKIDPKDKAKAKVDRLSKLALGQRSTGDSQTLLNTLLGPPIKEIKVIKKVETSTSAQANASAQGALIANQAELDDSNMADNIAQQPKLDMNVQTPGGSQGLVGGPSLEELSADGLSHNLRDFIKAVTDQQKALTESLQKISTEVSQMKQAQGQGPPAAAGAPPSRQDGAGDMDTADVNNNSDSVATIDELVEQVENLQCSDAATREAADQQAQGVLDRIMSNMHAEYEQEELGPNVKPNLAMLVKDMLQRKLSDEKSKEKAERQLRPQNLDLMQPPKVNREIWMHKKVKSWAKGQDLKYQRTQNLLLKGLVPIVNVINLLMDSTEDGLSPEDVVTTTTALLDSVSLLTDCNHELNHRRKDNFRRALPKEFSNLCTHSREVGAQLFGDDVVKDVKDINETNKLMNNASAGQGTGRGRGSSNSFLSMRGGRSGRSRAYRAHPYQLPSGFQHQMFPQQQMPMYGMIPQPQHFPRGGARGGYRGGRPKKPRAGKQ